MPTETDICNLGLGKLGGAGDALDGNAFITSIDGTDKVSAWCKIAFPRIRRRVIVDLATSDTPFRETIRFIDLGAELETFPEKGEWTYAFNLPGNCLVVLAQFDEDGIAIRFQPAQYTPDTEINVQWEIVANADGNGKILLTDTLNNSARTSAFIEAAIDITAPNAFSEGMIDCIATLLASEVAPVVGRDMEASNLMLAKYVEIVRPDAKKANQAGLNNSARAIADYSGGRTKILRNVP